MARHPGARFCEPASFQDDLAVQWALEDLLDVAPHRSLDEFHTKLIQGAIAQAEALPWAIRNSEADCVVAVWPHIDRAQHFFWRFRGTEHRLAGAVDSVYQALDRATAAVIEAFPGADVMVVSDHGAGDLKGDVNVGAWLAAEGHAVYGSPKRSGVSGLAWALPAPVRTLGRRLAPGVARKAMGAFLIKQLGPFDWARTHAFVGVHNDLWLNLAGREPEGMVDPADADSAAGRDLRRSARDPTIPRTGAPVFAAAHRRDDIYSGAATAMAPDLMLDPWSAGYRVAVKREPSAEVIIDPASLAGVDEAWSSDHRPEGIFVAAGPRIAPGASESLSLYDVAPAMLALLEHEVPGGSRRRRSSSRARSRIPRAPPGHDRRPLRSSGTVVASTPTTRRRPSPDTSRISATSTEGYLRRGGG